jgi:tetratricopeptide (TPR) repeat protein
LNTPIGGIYEFRQYLKSKNMDLISKDNVINYSMADTLKIWIKGPRYWDKKNKKLYIPKNVKLTKSVMPKDIVELCESGKCYIPNKAIKMYSYNDTANKSQTKEDVEDLIELGTKYLYDKNYKKAEEVYISVIKKDPENATAYSDLSYLYLKWDKYEQGTMTVKALDAKLTKSMNKNALAGAYYNAGLCYKNMGGAENLELAKTYMEKAKKQLPKVKVYQKEIDNINVKLQELKNAEKSKDAAKKKSKYESAKAKTSVKQLNQKHNNTKNQKTR